MSLGISSLVFELGKRNKRAVSGEHFVARPEPADTWAKQVIPALTDALGTSHLATLLARGEHASLLSIGDDPEDAVAPLRGVLKAAALPEDDPRATRLTLNLARALAAAGELDEALRLFERFEPLGSVPYDSWCGVVDSVAWICARLGLWERGAALPAEHLIASDCVPWFCLFAGELDRAERHWREVAVEMPWMALRSSVGLAWRYIIEGRFDEARPLLAEQTALNPEVSVATRACTDEDPSARPEPTDVISARLGDSVFSMVPDILALLSREGLLEPAILEELCGSNTTPNRLRVSLLDELVQTRPTHAKAQALRLAAAADGASLTRALAALPERADAAFWSALVNPLGRALALLTGADLRRYGDVDPVRQALARALAQRCPDVARTCGGRDVLALEDRWDEVLASIEHELAHDSLSDFTRGLLRAERHHALGHVDAERQAEERRQRTGTNLHQLASRTTDMRDLKLRDHILPAFAPWVWDWDSLLMLGVPMATLTTLRPMICRRTFFRARTNAQPALRDILAVCAPHVDRTTFGGKLYLGPGLRFDNVTTVLTDDTVAAFADTVDDLRRVHGDLLYAWWD